MSSSLLFLLLLSGLGIGGNILCDAQPVTCVFGACNFCPPSWTRYGGRCFLYVGIEKDWGDAESYCNGLSGHLASFHNVDEYNLIRTVIWTATGTNKKAWVGGTDAAKEGFWMWSDGSAFSYTHWGNGEPSNLGGHEDCMDINLNGQDYVSAEDCSQQNAFVCAKIA